MYYIHFKHFINYKKFIGSLFDANRGKYGLSEEYEKGEKEKKKRHVCINQTIA